MGAYGLKEIFHLARQLEENVQSYFRTGATECDDPDVSSTCLQIAEEEAKHSRDLQSIEDELLEDEKNLGMTWAELGWLQLHLEENVLSDIQDIKSFVKGATESDIVERAIQIERDSVAFYSRLMSELDASSRGLLDSIIEEERRHIEWLQKYRLDKNL